jgi:hypothetical protein
LLEFENADSLRKKFLPPYLHSIVADENAGWREKFSKSKNCLSLALRLFSQGNSEKILFSNFPLSRCLKLASPC